MDVADAHTQLIESIIEADDALMERYLGGEEIPAAEIAAAFVKAMMAGTLVPILFTEARQEVGVKELLSLIAKYMPSPGRRGTGQARRRREGDRGRRPTPPARWWAWSSASRTIRGRT